MFNILILHMITKIQLVYFVGANANPVLIYCMNVNI